MEVLNDVKPIITYAGDAKLFETFRHSLETGLPSEVIEWKRSFGRASKNVVVDAKFVPFKPESLSASVILKNLLDQPILHTYWIESPEMEAYKSVTKDELTLWLMQLRQCGISSDWMIVLVETTEAHKKSNKLLPRTSVLDKLKADLGGKQPERCISLLDPNRHDSKASEAWQTLLHRLRLLLLQSYNKVIGRFEENMRTQRERRNDAKWEFCDYFLLQEELAFVYEMLGQYDEALVQYDELDALFTQFVLNSHVSESPQWLTQFTEELTNWSGVSLESPEINSKLREAIIKRSPSLLAVRNYLFSRQGSLILKMEKPYEVAQRTLTFLHNVNQELQILEISCPPGSIACWVFLSLLEVLLVCQKACDKSPNIQLMHFFRQTADLWSYARMKLHELGELCGLLPGNEPTSAQLHLVVELSSGIQDHNSLQTNSVSPVSKLKEALTSKNGFQKYYLDLSETAISTYKHIGRIRSARLVGIDLAKFYLQLEQVQNAVTFLVDALKTFDLEGWSLLTVQTLLEVAVCYEKLGEPEKLLRICSMLSCSKNLISMEERHKHFQKMKSLAITSEEEVCTDGEQLFKVISCQILPIKGERYGSEKRPIIPGSEVWLELHLESNFPLDLPYEDISIALTQGPPSVTCNDTTSGEKSKRKVNRPVLHTFSGTGLAGPGIHRTPSNRSTTSIVSSAASSLIQEGEDLSDSNEVGDLNLASLKIEDENRLKISEELDFKQDKSLSGVRIVCRNANRFLKRKDSSGSMLKETSARRSNFKYAFLIEHDPSLGEQVLKSGPNSFLLRTTAGPIGVYTLQQLSIRVFNKKLDFLADINDLVIYPNATPESNRFSVISEPPMLSLVRYIPGPLWAGIEQSMKLSISTGSYTLKKGTEVNVRCSLGLTALQVRDDDIDDTKSILANQLKITLPEAKPFETVQLQLRVRADLLQQHTKEGSTIEHRLIIEEFWGEDSSEKVLHLHFVPPFSMQARVQTALTRKFLQVSFQATMSASSNINEFSLQNPSLESLGENSSSSSAIVSFKPVNSQDAVLMLKRQSVCNYIWEIASTDSDEILAQALKAKLTIQYQRSDSPRTKVTSERETGVLTANFDFKDCQTLYLLRSRIDPAKGSELCRASTICSLSISVEQVNHSNHTSLMYEVLADQAFWAVCGRVAGVINMENSTKQTLVVEVMPLVGGHLALPRVRLSKYIPAATGTPLTNQSTTENSPQSLGSRDSGSMPRLEPFSSGQIYNCSRTSRIHVLPAAATTSNVGNRSNASPMSHLHLFSHHHEQHQQGLVGEGHASLP